MAWSLHESRGSELILLDRAVGGEEAAAAVDIVPEGCEVVAAAADIAHAPFEACGIPLDHVLEETFADQSRGRRRNPEILSDAEKKIIVNCGHSLGS